MKILDKIKAKAENNMDFEGVTVAFLGDSVTQGCFELSVFDRRSSYEQYFSDMMASLFPTVPVNIINAGIASDNARRGALRVGRDVLRHEPDLTIVCYGLNDCGETQESIDRYVHALSEIFDQIKKSGSELIFMTPNMMNTKLSPDLTDPEFIKIATVTARKQTSGMFDAHIEAAKELCRQNDIPVCDCYAIWKALDHGGVNVTNLLANKINHPTREMNRIFAYELIKTIFLTDKN